MQFFTESELSFLNGRLFLFPTATHEIDSSIIITDKVSNLILLSQTIWTIISRYSTVSFRYSVHLGANILIKNCVVIANYNLWQHGLETLDKYTCIILGYKIQKIYKYLTFVRIIIYLIL